MNERLSPQRLRTRGYLAASVATVAAGALTVGLVSGVAGNADAAGSTSGGSTSAAPTSTGSSSAGSSTSATAPSSSASSSSSADSNGISGADQDAGSDGGSNGS